MAIGKRIKEGVNTDDKNLKKLKVDLEDISIIMEANIWDNRPVLDTNTGKIIHIPEDLNERNIYNEEDIKKLPEWEKEKVEEVKGIFEDFEERYIPIPERISNDAYDIMVEFINTLNDTKLSTKLFNAIDGRGAFRRFKDLPGYYPKTQERWYEYKTKRQKHEALKWLYSIGIKPVE